jgi:hypothetical protein
MSFIPVASRYSEPFISQAARRVLTDFQRRTLPFWAFRMMSTAAPERKVRTYHVKPSDSNIILLDLLITLFFFTPFCAA